MNPAYVTIALQDITRGLQDFRLAGFLAWQDIRRRYIRTLFGPWWIVLSMGIWFSVAGLVMANLLHLTLHDYLPFMMSGMLIWTLISTSISEGSNVLLHAAPIIKSFPIPIFTHYLRFVFRNFFIFLHNVLLLIIVMLVYPQQFTMVTWLVIPGLFLNMLILMNIAVCLSLANLRYRDTGLAVASNLQVLPFVTPIFWDRGMVQNHRWVADINPFYHMIEVVRSPFLGHSPNMLSWLVTTGLAAGTLWLALFVFVRFRHRIILWL